MKKVLKQVFAIAIVLSTLLLCALPAAANFSYPPIVMKVENCSSYITLRAKANGGAAEIVRIPLNAEVTYLAAAENGFYKVEYNGYIGYALSTYLGYKKFVPNPDDTDQDYHTANNPCTVVDCQEFITLRDKPAGQEIVKVPLGGVVDYLGNSQKGYCQVSYRGVTGYVQEKYVAPVDYSYSSWNNTITLTVINCQRSITLRATPSTNGKEILQIPLGAKVEFIDHAANNFYKVTYRGYTGYALAHYLTE